MDWFKEIVGIPYSELNKVLIKLGTNIVVCILILVVGFWLIKQFIRVVKKILTRSNTDPGLVTFLTSAFSIILKAFTIVTAITQLGVQMTSFVALLGAAGLAIGMAFSGTLSNFAGGVFILMLKPFKVGDTVLTQGEKGVVREIQIFNTYLYTSDNKVVILPNGLVANNKIINFTKENKRRVEWLLILKVGSDIGKAKEIILSEISKDERVIKSKPIAVDIQNVTIKGIEVVVQAWTENPNFSDLFHDLYAKFYAKLPENGINYAVEI